MSHPFFENHGPLKLSDILNIINITLPFNNTQKLIYDIKDLISADSNSISFFHSKKYKSYANITKASYCITTENLSIELPKSCVPLIVKDVLIGVAKITQKFYPTSIQDCFDDTVDLIENTKFKSY